MAKHLFILFFLIITFSISSFSQKITYSDPDKEDARNVNFEIIGKVAGNTLIYKNYRDLHFVYIYDNDMKLLNKVKLTDIPEKVTDAEFVQYPDFFYMIYQYQRKDIVYCMGLKIDGNGNEMQSAIVLDTTQISYNASTKIYSVIKSEDKQKIVLFKINSRNEKMHYVTTVLTDKYLDLIHRTKLPVSMPDKNSFLTEFQVDNDGDLAFFKAVGSSQNDNISKLTFFIKRSLSDSVSQHDLNLRSLNLDDIRMKIDNYNKHYLVGSFYSKQRRGNVDGLYLSVWDKEADRELTSSAVTFSDDLRNDAKGESTLKMAFNDYFLKNIIVRRDGGFILCAESVYTSSRGNNLSRWDYMYGSPYFSPYGSAYYMYASPFSYNYYNPWNRFGNAYGNYNRYFADNIVILSIGIDGKMEWSNVVKKSQYDDISDQHLGYGFVNSGDQIHFLFNAQEKRQTVLTDQSITPEGQLNRNPTFHNLDKGFDFMPRQAKQISARVCIIPCMIRNYICFAKVEL
jgi:hypothetical protein